MTWALPTDHITGQPGTVGRDDDHPHDGVVVGVSTTDRPVTRAGHKGLVPGLLLQVPGDGALAVHCADGAEGRRAQGHGAAG